jgi:tRNA pseudouridine13 synthase
VLPRGVIKEKPEDFIVDEIPLYEPSGQGEHLYVRFTKRGLTTDQVVRAFARAMSVHPRDVGVPGLKDKVGVTTQTISLPVPPAMRLDPSFEERARGFMLEGVTIRDVKKHGNKLRTGHLGGNVFQVVVRDVETARAAEAVATLERIGREGAPNAFGSQRFGREGDNAARAQSWLRGEWSGPRDGRARRFLWSSLQSAIFNDVLQRRITDGTWTTPLLGDLLQKEDSGGLFLCADVQADRARADRGEVSPTGPLPGMKMRAPEGDVAALELDVTTKWLGESPLTSGILEPVRQLGEGTRRALRVLVRDLRVEVEDQANPGNSGEQRSSVRVYFVLPKGAYATTVLEAAFALDETPHAESATEPAAPSDENEPG